jgi:hypothetical protein
LKKSSIVLAAIGLFFVLGIAGAYADQSDYYYLHLPIAKIYSHPLGYRVVYSPSYGVYKDAYLPFAWFVPGGKGELVFDHGPAYPYMEVFYKNGKFDHVRLYAETDSNSPTWKTLPATLDLSKEFAIDDLKLEF